MAATVQRTFVYEAEAFRSYCHRHFGANLDYSFESVALLDGILGECHEGLKGMHEHEAWTYLNNLCLAAGSYLGEILVREAGGSWRLEGDPRRLQDWVVLVPGGKGGRSEAVPCFDAIRRFLSAGPHETLLRAVAVAAPKGRVLKAAVGTPSSPRRRAKPGGRG